MVSYHFIIRLLLYVSTIAVQLSLIRFYSIELLFTKFMICLIYSYHYFSLLTLIYVFFKRLSNMVKSIRNLVCSNNLCHFTNHLASYTCIMIMSYLLLHLCCMFLLSPKHVFTYCKLLLCFIFLLPAHLFR